MPEISSTIEVFLKGNKRTTVAYNVKIWHIVQEIARKMAKVLIEDDWFPEYIIKILQDIGVFSQILKLMKTNIPLKLLIEILEPYLSVRKNFKVLRDFFEEVFKVSNKSDSQSFLEYLNILTPQDLETFDEGAYDKYLELLRKFVNIKSLNTVYCDSLDTHTEFGLKLLECKNIPPRSFGAKFLKHLKSKSKSDRKLIEPLSRRLTQVLFNDPHEKILNESEELILDILRESSKTIGRKQLLESILKSLVDYKDKTILKATLTIVRKLLESHEDEMLKLLLNDP